MRTLPAAAVLEQHVAATARGWRPNGGIGGGGSTMSGGSAASGGAARESLLDVARLGDGRLERRRNLDELLAARLRMTVTRTETSTRASVGACSIGLPSCLFGPPARAFFTGTLAFLFGTFARHACTDLNALLTRSGRQPALQQVRCGARVLA